MYYYFSRNSNFTVTIEFFRSGLVTTGRRIPICQRATGAHGPERAHCESPAGVGSSSLKLAAHCGLKLSARRAAFVRKKLRSLLAPPRPFLRVECKGQCKASLSGSLWVSLPAEEHQSIQFNYRDDDKTLRGLLVVLVLFHTS